MTLNPANLNTAVATNPLADIPSERSGGIGVGPTANIASEQHFSLMFERIGSFTIDFAAQDISNPTATYRSGATMLDAFGRAGGVRPEELLMRRAPSQACMGNGLARKKL